MLRNIYGGLVPDRISPNNKLCCGYFPSFVTQENQFVLGNGVFLSPEAKKKLGKRFDRDVQDCGHYALIHGETYGYWAVDRLYPFPIAEVDGTPEFVPLFDSSTSTLRAGIRYWRLDDDEPLNFVIYEEDGFTQYQEYEGKTSLAKKKQPYKDITSTTKAFGTEIVGGENYSTLPIKRLKGNKHGISELKKIKPLIDNYDRTFSGLANDVDNASFIYWLISGADGTEPKDAATFLELVKLTGVAIVGEGQEAKPATVDVPYEARMAQLDKIEKNLYKSFGAVDTDALSGSNMVTAQIRAAYAALDAKADAYEFELNDFIQAILELVGIDEEPRFKRSYITNDLEETQRVMLMREELDDETTLEMLPGIQPEEIPDILRKREEQSQSRYTAMEPQQPQNGLTEPQE